MKVTTGTVPDGQCERGSCCTIIIRAARAQLTSKRSKLYLMTFLRVWAGLRTISDHRASVLSPEQSLLVLPHTWCSTCLRSHSRMC